jgi:hypothetical protein
MLTWGFTGGADGTRARNRCLQLAHDSGLEDLRLHLSATWPDPGGGVLGHPPITSPAARSIAASYADAMSGSSDAASDQDFGPLMTTSTNLRAYVSSRSRPLTAPVSTS